MKDIETKLDFKKRTRCLQTLVTFFQQVITHTIKILHLSI